VSENDSFALLEDIARLVKKHGPKAFSDLSSILRDPGKIEEFITILEAGASAGRRAKIYKSGAPPGRQRAASVGLGLPSSHATTTDPEKADLLSGFYEDLLARRVMPTLRELREFASENHLRGAKAESREKAIGPLVRDLSLRPSDQIASILAGVRPAKSVKDDRSLERWADVILDKNRSRGT
jgi:hypothetical protein